MMEKASRNPTKIIEKSMKIGQVHLELRSGGVPEALGRGLETILAPKGAPGTKNIPKGHRSFHPQGPSCRPKLTLFRFLGFRFGICF